MPCSSSRNGFSLFGTVLFVSILLILGTGWTVLTFNENQTYWDTVNHQRLRYLSKTGLSLAYDNILNTTPINASYSLLEGDIDITVSSRIQLAFTVIPPPDHLSTIPLESLLNLDEFTLISWIPSAAPSSYSLSIPTSLTFSDTTHSQDFITYHETGASLITGFQSVTFLWTSQQTIDDPNMLLSMTETELNTLAYSRLTEQDNLYTANGYFDIPSVEVFNVIFKAYPLYQTDLSIDASHNGLHHNRVKTLFEIQKLSDNIGLTSQPTSLENQLSFIITNDHDTLPLVIDNVANITTDPDTDIAIIDIQLTEQHQNVSDNVTYSLFTLDDPAITNNHTLIKLNPIGLSPINSIPPVYSLDITYDMPITSFTGQLYLYFQDGSYRTVPLESTS